MNINDLSTGLKKYGYYKFDNKIFVNKHDVLDYAILQKNYNPNIEFIFHDEIYSKIDWKIEPSIDLETLYFLRAKQLRDTYDYLILQYSGGADSHQVLFTFLKNNIHIDEIQTYYPTSLLDKIDHIKDRTHDLAGMFEYNFTAVPVLKFIEKKYPKIKINIIDTTNYLKQNLNERFLSDNFKHLRIAHTLLLPMVNLQSFDVINSFSEKLSGKTIGVIYGADKPFPIIQNNELFFSFHDTGRSGLEAQTYTKNDNRFVPEMFYWSPELPLIPIKQMHIINNYLKLKIDKNFYDDIVSPKYKKFGNYRTYSQNKIEELIYPFWNKNIFQNVIKGQDDIIFKYLFSEYSFKTNNLNLRKKSWSNNFVDTLLDIKNLNFIEKYNKFNSSKLFSFKTNKSTNNIYILYSKIESKFYKISDLDINDSL